ncbi:restriction endonuclease subunit S [Pseudomonas sp. URMO17WK12:I4]|uniref:restriction endonuclease subunit S n=1 Tax=Pseudomonas sp. URMO17WK12:I4 TaxID=1283292 RepID=UPI0006887191|nr:restriction endonuclease subunit S [Pseudomonas sp. URMO17WK12:I4]
MRLVEVGEICRFEYGKSLSERTRIPGKFFVYGSNGPVGSHATAFTQGKTIVIGRKGSIGEVHVSNDSCWPIDTTYFIDSTCTDCDLDWLAYNLKHLNLAELNKASGVPGLNRDDAYKQKVWLPETKNEQYQIAAYLKAQLAEVETARQASQTLVWDAKLLKTKIVDSTFGELRDWQPIAAVAKVQSGYAFKSQDFKTSGVRLLRNTNILPGQVYWDEVVCLDENEATRYQSYALEEGDILISLDRPLISSGIKVARVETADLPSLLLQRVGRFIPKPGAIDPGFLYAFLQSSRFIGAISGHDQSLGVPHISPGQVESVELPCLSLDEQRRIVTRLYVQLAEADSIAQTAAMQLAEIERLPQKLLARAFDAQGA